MLTRTVVWVGWWAALAFSILLPHILQHTLVVVAPELRTYVLYLVNLKVRRRLRFALTPQRNSAFAIWALVNWITWNPLINNNTNGTASQGTLNTLHKVTQGLFGIWILVL